MKTSWTLLPFTAVRRCAEVMSHGKGKHGFRTWFTKYTIEDHLDAAFRHLGHHMEGEVVNDEDWGLNHLDHAACRLLMAAEILRSKQLVRKTKR